MSILNDNVKPPDGYATGSWKLASQSLNKFLKHHYAVNRHHPEHFTNGIDGMTLIDLLEMLVDWQASTLRTADGDIYKSIQFNSKSRFKISSQLTRILMNTALEFDELLGNMREDYSEGEVITE